MKLILSIVLLLSLFYRASGQNECRYPFDQSADSLVKFVIADIYNFNTSRQVNAKFHSKEFNQHFYNPESRVNHDSVFQICINDLREKLGNELLCKNIDMYVNSFYVSKNQDNYVLSFGFTYPVLKREEPVRLGTFTSYNERINTEYKYSVNSNGKLSITFPNNVPDCKGKPDCNIYVTREKAVEILNHRGLIKENDTIRMSVNGLHWDITLSSNDWAFRHLKIHIQTGELSNFRESHRID